MSNQIEIDLGKAFGSDAEKKEVIEQIQNEIALHVKASTGAISLAQDLENQNAELTKQLRTVTAALQDTATIVKGFNSVLGQHAELVNQDPEFKAYADEIAKFVLSAGMIKLGVKHEQ